MPAPPAGVNVAVGEAVALNWLASNEGPETTDHVPAPALGVLAASVAETVVVQSVWSAPAAAVVGAGLTVTVTLSVPVQPLASVTVTV